MLSPMSAEPEHLVALMPFAGRIGLVLDEASPDRAAGAPSGEG